MLSTLLFVISIAGICQAEVAEQFPGVFWPPYTSHLLQSTKAQSKY